MAKFKVKGLPQWIRGPIKQVSRKQTAFIRAGDSIDLATGWEGGSRSQFYRIDLATGRSEYLSGNSESAWFASKRSTPTFTLSPGTGVIDCGTFLGKPATPSVVLLPEDFARLSSVPVTS